MLMFIIYVLLIRGEHEKMHFNSFLGVGGRGGAEDVNTTSH